MASGNLIETNVARPRMLLQQVRIAESIAAELRAGILSADEWAVLSNQDEPIATACFHGLDLQTTQVPRSDLSHAIVFHPVRHLDPGSAENIPSERKSPSKLLYSLTSEWEPTP